MLSMQIDRLRSCADLYDGTTKPEMTKELQRPYLAQELRDAADTIWQLRDDLQRANDAVRDAEHDESRAWDRVRKAEAENAKLRQQLADVTESMWRVEKRCAKLREWCGTLLGAAEDSDPKWPYWLKVHDALSRLGVEICVRAFFSRTWYADRMRELWTEVDE